MPLMDKLAAARKLDELLKGIIAGGGFRLKYRIVVDPPIPDNRDWEKPDILVDLSGADSPLLLERGGELLRAFEHVGLQALKLGPDEHEKISFDCMNQRAMRLEELKVAAAVAAERVRKTGMPYEFSPMSSRERRMLHLALRDEAGLRTESQGEAGARCVVLMPKDYNPQAAKPKPFGRRR